MNFSIDYNKYEDFFENIPNGIRQHMMRTILTELALFGTLVLGFIHWKRYTSAITQIKNKRRRYPRPPLVGSAWPILGHWYPLYKDRIGFLKHAYQTYGPIFQINIFLKKFIYICDRDLQDEFYHAPDEKLSLTGILRDMKLNLIFMDQLSSFWPAFNLLLRKVIALSFPKFSPILKEGAETALLHLTKSMDLDFEVTNYVLSVPPKCIFNIPSSSRLYQDFVSLRPFLRAIIFSSHLLPDWLINPIIKLCARSYMGWKKMGNEFIPEIEKYAKDSMYDESLLLRYLTDEKFKGRQLTIEEIKSLILLFVHKNSENTINCLRNLLIDLAENQDWWLKLREECSHYVAGNKIIDTKGLLQSQILHACLMESTRLNSNVVVSRRTTRPNTCIGNYYVGYADEVVPCATFYMVDSSYHKDSLRFNPNRYIVDKELYTPKYHTTWGSGVHQCPGKVLVQNAVKMFVALVTTNYDIELNPNVSTAKSYFTVSPFIVRKLEAKLTKI